MAKRSFFRRNKVQEEIIIDKPVESEERSRTFSALAFSSGGTFRSSKALNLSAVYRCVNLISDSISQLPIQIMDIEPNGFKTVNTVHSLNKIVNEKPNARMSRFILMKTAICSMLLYGDAYIYIERNAKKEIIGLHYIPYEFVTVNIPEFLNQPVTYTVTGIKERVEESDMIHLIQFTSDGIHGESVLKHGADVLSLAWSAEESAKTLYENGGNLFGILRYNGSLQKSQKEELKRTWNEAKFGGGQLKGVCLLDDGFDYKPISISPADQQLLSSREYSSVQICQLFGVSPAKVFCDNSATSYNSLEQENLAFLTNTLQPIIVKIEQEFNRKLFPSGRECVHLDTTELIRNDSAGLSAYITKLLSWGVININEGRKMLNLAPIENGDKSFVPVNVMPVDKAVNNTATDNKIVTEDIKVDDEKDTDSEQENVHSESEKE